MKAQKVRILKKRNLIDLKRKIERKIKLQNIYGHFQGLLIFILNKNVTNQRNIHPNVATFDHSWTNDLMRQKIREIFSRQEKKVAM